MIQPHGPSVIDFFLQTLELYDILYDVLVGLYSSPTGENGSADEVWGRYLGRSGINNDISALDIERKLVQWEDRLPAHLKLDGHASQTELNGYFTRQAVILHQR